MRVVFLTSVIIFRQSQTGAIPIVNGRQTSQRRPVNVDEDALGSLTSSLHQSISSLLPPLPVSLLPAPAPAASLTLPPLPAPSLRKPLTAPSSPASLFENNLTKNHADSNALDSISGDVTPENSGRSSIYTQSLDDQFDNNLNDNSVNNRFGRKKKIYDVSALQNSSIVFRKAWPME